MRKPNGRFLRDRLSHLFLGNAGSSPKDAIFTVSNGSTTSGGTFGLSVTPRPVASNAACAAAKPIAFGTPVTGEDLRAAYADAFYSGGCASNTTAAGQLFYRTPPLPANTSIYATVTLHGPFHAAINFFDDCQLTCASVSITGPFEPDQAIATTTAASSGLIVAVGPSPEPGYAGERGTFDLLLTVPNSNDAAAPNGCITP